MRRNATSRGARHREVGSYKLAKLRYVTDLLPVLRLLEQHSLEENAVLPLYCECQLREEKDMH